MRTSALAMQRKGNCYSQHTSPFRLTHRNSAIAVRGRLRLEERPPHPVGNAEVSPSHTAPVLVRSLGVRSFLLSFFGEYCSTQSNAPKFPFGWRIDLGLYEISQPPLSHLTSCMRTWCYIINLWSSTASRAVYREGGCLTVFVSLSSVTSPIFGG